MVLLIDVGNSNINLALYDNDDQPKHFWRIKTDRNKTTDEYAIILNNLFFGETIEGVVIGSVVPTITQLLIDYAHKYLEVEPLVLGTGLKTGLDIHLNNPREIGADLVATAVGAMNKYPQPTIIIDLGTATTLSLIENNIFHGGIIVPGIETSLNSLVANTALLPHVELKAPRRVVEKETIACMQSGIIYGTAAMLDGLIDRMEEEFGKRCFVVATGGLARFIVQHCKHKITYDERLIFEGLLAIYHKNR